jgi:threonine dehydrogenase-like Zn-dependent dehydrogenase
MKEKTMMAQVFKGNGVLELEERPVPRIEKPDDVILRVGGVGVCGSDVAILSVPRRHPAKPGVIFGHEFAGIVEEIGPAVKNVKVGDHVCVDQNPGCGVCDECRKGHFNNCRRLMRNPIAVEQGFVGFPNTPGQFWDGAMAKYVKVPSWYLYKIREDIPMWKAAAFEPLGVVMNGINKVKPLAGETACVIGAGPIGAFATALFKLGGLSKIIVSETSPERRELIRKLGDDIIIINPLEENLIDVVKNETNGDGVDIVVEAVGTQLPLASNLIAFHGRIMNIGIPRKIEWEPLNFASKEGQIFTVWLMGQKAPSDALRLLESDKLPMDILVTHKFPLERAREAVDMAANGKAGKVIIQPNGDI